MLGTATDFIFAPQGNELLVKLNDQHNIPSEEEVMSALAGSEYRLWQAQTGLDVFLSAQQQQFLTDKTFVLAKALDAEIELIVSADKLEVSAEVTPSYGGTELNLDQIKQACINKGIKFGLKTSLCRALLEECKDGGKELYVSVIGKGKPPEDGEDAYLKPLVSLLTEIATSPKQNDDGTFDLKDLGSIASIAKGTLVAEKIPATKGVDGMDVFGEFMQAKDGKDFELKPNDSVAISPDNELQLVSLLEGIPRQNGNTMKIDDVFTVTEVNPKQGHVKFNGSVIVKGDVYPDMKLEAKGDIVIGGFVESANIQCHGDITVMGGVSGKIKEADNQKEFNCTLTSGGSINVAFANQAKITAKKTVTAKRQLSHCQVTAYSVWVGDKRRANGQVIAGTYHLCKTLDAGVVGNDSFGHVDIDLNRTYNIFLQKEADLWLWIEEKEEEFAALETTYESLPMSQKDAFYPQVETLGKKIDRYKHYRKQLMDKRREYMNQVEVRAHQTLYPNVSCFLTDKAIMTERTYGPCHILVDEYEVKVAPM